MFGGAGLGAVTVVGGAGAVLVEEDMVPGKVRFDRAIGRCRTLSSPPETAGVVQRQSFRSRHRGTDVTATVVLPAGVTSLRGLPIAVAMHGNGGTGSSAADGLKLDRYLTDAVRTRHIAPFAMITDELLPRLGRQGAQADRFGVIGWSMGGYGALVLAETVGAPRMAAMVASSPALFDSYESAHRTNHLSFDNAADFARNDVLARLDRLKDVPTWVDCGTSDPFATMARRLRGRLHPAGAMSRGCHDGAFWLRLLPAQLAFLGEHLARRQP
jgi:enterochelin esterase-like enzyme